MTEASQGVTLTQASSIDTISGSRTPGVSGVGWSIGHRLQRVCFFAYTGVSPPPSSAGQPTNPPPAPGHVVPPTPGQKWEVLVFFCVFFLGGCCFSGCWLSTSGDYHHLFEPRRLASADRSVGLPFPPSASWCSDPRDRGHGCLVALKLYLLAALCLPAFCSRRSEGTSVRSWFLAISVGRCTPPPSSLGPLPSVGRVYG